MTQPASQWLDKTIEEGALSVTIACVSGLTNEEGGIVVTPRTTLEMVMNEYARQFPKEAAAYKLKIHEINANLINRSGTSAEGRMAACTQIPEFILWAMRAIRRDYWNTKASIYNFIRSYPAFMIGDKTRKQTSGVIIK